MLKNLKSQFMDLLSRNKRLFLGVMIGLAIASPPLGYAFRRTTSQPSTKATEQASNITNHPEANDLHAEDIAATDTSTANTSRATSGTNGSVRGQTSVTSNTSTAVTVSDNKKTSSASSSASTGSTSSGNGSTNTEPTPVTASVSISDDGCFVTATGTPGLLVIVSGTSPDGMRGWEGEFTIPSSGTLVQSTGGAVGLVGSGKVKNASGAVIASASAAITAEICPAP